MSKKIKLFSVAFIFVEDLLYIKKIWIVEIEVFIWIWGSTRMDFFYLLKKYDAENYFNSICLAEDKHSCMEILCGGSHSNCSPTIECTTIFLISF